MKRAKKKPQARMGRPPKPAGEAKNVIFTLRISQSERDKIEAAAKLAGQAPTAWARACLLDAAEADD